MTEDDVLRDVEIWLQSQSHQTQIWFAVRCALKCAHFLNLRRKDRAGESLFIFIRALFLASVASHADNDRLKQLAKGLDRASQAAANASLVSADPAITSASNAAASAAVEPQFQPYNYAFEAFGGFVQSVSSPLFFLSALPENVGVARVDVVNSVLLEVAKSAFDERDASSPWGAAFKFDYPELVENSIEYPSAFTRHVDADTKTWRFWNDWFQGMSEGAPLTWELCFEIATELTIDDWEGHDDWEANARHVARRIEEIRAEWDGEQIDNDGRFHELEPSNVSYLWDHAPIAVSSFEGTAQSIAVGFDAFRADARLNQTPEVFKALERVPASLDRLENILRGQKSDAAEDALKAEIGRLNAKVAALVVALSAARVEISELKASNCKSSISPWWGAAIGSVLSAPVWGTLTGALMIASEDEFHAVQRINNLIEERAALIELFEDKPIDATPYPPVRPRDFN